MLVFYWLIDWLIILVGRSDRCTHVWYHATCYQTLIIIIAILIFLISVMFSITDVIYLMCKRGRNHRLSMHCYYTVVDCDGEDFSNTFTRGQLWFDENIKYYHRVYEILRINQWMDKSFASHNQNPTQSPAFCSGSGVVVNYCARFVSSHSHGCCGHASSGGHAMKAI